MRNEPTPVQFICIVVLGIRCCTVNNLYGTIYYVHAYMRIHMRTNGDATRLTYCAQCAVHYESSGGRTGKKRVYIVVNFFKKNV